MEILEKENPTIQPLGRVRFTVVKRKESSPEKDGEIVPNRESKFF